MSRTRQLILYEVADNCTGCPLLDRDSPAEGFCTPADKPVVDFEVIPYWCPLQNGGRVVVELRA